MRNSYHTQQRCALLAFLSAHADEQFTVEQLLAAMGDEAPGRSTVYRALDRLVEEGTVRRFAPESGGSAASLLDGTRFLVIDSIETLVACGVFYTLTWYNLQKRLNLQ